MTTKVVKRNGESTELDLEKVHRMVEHACEGLAGVSESAVEMNSGLQFYDCLLYTSPSPRDLSTSRMPSSA